ncbi:MAG: DUF2634 domain-containing protein [Oscillospiraceae bacterium]|nr:DUF2634 domain-containing protein [Oscillospiraceae bacterium]
MIPNHNGAEAVSLGRLAETTFYLDEETGEIRGMTDGYQAARQAAWLILHTERYAFLIYSWEYGTELQGLLGSADSFLISEIKRRVAEALLVDDRITGASGFVFERRRNRMEVRFTVHTIYGDAALWAEI